MLVDVSAAVRLQELDQRAAELTREISALPKHIAEIEKKLESHQRRLEADRAALAANQKERRKLEGDIQLLEQKISKLKDQMLQAKTNEQYRAFQNEISYGEHEIRKHEDRILDLMAESEPLEKNVKEAEQALKEEKAEVEREKQQARERTEADKKALAEIGAARQAAVASMTPGVYAIYERLRKHKGGIAVAEAVDGGCSACHIALRPQVLQDLKRGDQLLTCDSCGRILYFVPPTDVEAMNGANAAVATAQPTPASPPDGAA